MWLLKESNCDAQPGCQSLFVFGGLRTLLVICANWGSWLRAESSLSLQGPGERAKILGGRSVAFPGEPHYPDIYSFTWNKPSVCMCDIETETLRQVWCVAHRKGCTGWGKLCAWAQMPKGCTRRGTELGAINLLTSLPHWAERPSFNISQPHPGAHLQKQWAFLTLETDWQRWA